MTSSEPQREPATATVAAFPFVQLESQVVDSYRAPQDVLAAVQDEAERIREAARAEGEREGLEAGRAVARAELEAQLALLGAAAAALHETEAELIASAERGVVDIALRLAEQILSGAIAVEPARVLDVARNALRHFAERRQVTLLVNPEDLDLLRNQLAALGPELGGIDRLDVQGDRRVGHGGAIARTQAGEIDAGLNRQLERAREIVAEALSGPDERPASTGGRQDLDS